MIRRETANLLGIFPIGPLLGPQISRQSPALVIHALKPLWYIRPAHSTQYHVFLFLKGVNFINFKDKFAMFHWIL
jgi:hypothetical protein